LSEELARKGIVRCDLVMGVAGAFVALTSVAMLLYVGGNDHNAHARGYSFVRNFFSDLGATRTYLHRLNVGSAVLFMLALSLIGISVILLSLEHSTLEGSGRLQRLGKVAVVAGFVSGLAFVGVAAVPWNLSGYLHLLLVQVAFGFLFIMVAIFTALQVANGWSRVYLWLNIVYAVILAAYVAILFFGPDPDLTLSGLEFQVIAQKVVVYSSMINIGLQAYGIRARLKSITLGDAPDAA